MTPKQNKVAMEILAWIFVAIIIFSIIKIISL